MAFFLALRFKNYVNFKRSFSHMRNEQICEMDTSNLYVAAAAAAIAVVASTSDIIKFDVCCWHTHIHTQNIE